ncbi:hypothetical protein SAMN05444397_11222 [Flavobacterium aquidurense]|uniref:Uncharacterized protein n=1 Tax=Flavobacterium frigidimaris TaxID=262320 RepID=A0ABX4BKF9_FLAFR|nr:hypothetical protein [Flavobacterium frigidimaris]OXA75725.1 hypothetical protein B0A65_21135 [Flavobacterium frigidimaris]SDZ63621.1 hypothetical protein SAMN05444397_11222 [Flavobacterium aquidurense]
MSYEKVREEFIKDAEEYIRAKRQPFAKLAGADLELAKYEYLENFQDYINFLNFRIIARLDENLISFKSLEEATAFQDFMKPTFEMLARKYTEGLMD